MTLAVAVLAALTASAAAALTPSHGYAASFAGGRPIAAAVVRDGAHQDLQFPGMEAGFTVSAWLKFGDTSSSRVQPALEITIEDDCCFFMYPGVRRVAGRVRVEKRVIGHIFALGCVSRRKFVSESTAGRVSRRERAPSGSPASGVGCGV